MEESCVKKKSASLLRDCLYPKPLDPPPKPIAWGRSYEFVAIQKNVAERLNTTLQKVDLLIILRVKGLGQLQMVLYKMKPVKIMVSLSIDKPLP